jgi:cytidylate kinase
MIACGAPFPARHSLTAIANDSMPETANQFAALRPAIIAIDGPAASGKSTIGLRIANLSGFLFFDTGVMYRAVTWTALERLVDVHDEAAVGALAASIVIEPRAPTNAENDGRQVTVLVDDLDVSWQIRQPQVDQNVSAVSAHPPVRLALSLQQRRIGLAYGWGEGDKPGIVMVGRDIGTVVLPEAPLKVYMDASAEERARRRHAELLARGKSESFQQVLADIVARDLVDSERAASPLRPATDALVIDTTRLTLDQVVERILAAVGRT